MGDEKKENVQNIELKAPEYPKNNEEVNDHVMNSDRENILSDDDIQGRKICKWKLEGMNIVILSVIILSASLTIALFFNILFGPPQVTPHGAVVVDDEICGDIGIKIMQEENGNAVDAAVATILCLTVSRPDVASLAGCGGILIRDRNEPISHLFDFHCPSPSTLTDSKFPNPEDRSTLVGIPGMVRGLLSAHKRFGTKKWEHLFDSAITVASKGFMPSKALVAAAKALNPISRDAFPMVVDIQSGGIYHPPKELVDTLRYVSTTGDAYFYANQSEKTSFGDKLVDFMKSLGTTWSLSDVQQYKSRTPGVISTTFAGFKFETFPSPFVGGPFISSILNNLELLNKEKPLNTNDLLQNKPETVAIALNRAIQLSILTASDIAKLGDLDDSTIASESVLAQDALFSEANHKAKAEAVKDTGVLMDYGQSPLLPSTNENSRIGGTGVVTTDSKGLTVVANIFLGSPFGSELMVPNTGVHLNSALLLFSRPNSGLNSPANNRRPLVPVSPIYVSTLKKKCGVRVGVSSFPQLLGLIDVTQVITNAVLYLQNITCAINENKTKKDSTIQPSNSNPYSPAADQSCVNLLKALTTPRLYPRLDSARKNSLLTEPGFSDELIKQFKQYGYTIAKSNQNWPSRVFIAGWNGYELDVAKDPRSGFETLFTY